MANVRAYEKSNSFRFDVTTEILVDEKPTAKERRYEFAKNAPAGQTQEQYLQACKREALLLAQHEENQKNFEVIEIII